MKKIHHTLTEHYLVPAALFLLNICLAHLIYAFASGSTYPPISRIALALAFVLLGSSLVLKKQIHLAGSILFYTLVVLWI
jgi:hypothetical protein